MTMLRDLEVHVVVTARDPARQAAAEWQEGIRHGRRLTFEEFRERVLDQSSDSDYARRFRAAQDLPGVLARWLMLDETVLPGQFAKDLTRQLAQQQRDVPACASHGSDATETDTKAQQSPALSSRETAILKRLMLGSSNKAIAYKMAITEATVKVHIKSILRKIRARNRTQAAIWAVTNLSDALDMPEKPIPAALNGNGTNGSDERRTRRTLTGGRLQTGECWRGGVNRSPGGR